MRDAKVTQIYEGANQIQRLVIAHQLLKGYGIVLKTLLLIQEIRSSEAEMIRTLRLPLIPIFFAYTIGLYLGHFDFPFPFQGFILLLLILLVLWALFMMMKRTTWGSWIALSLFFFLGIFSIHNYLHPQLPPPTSLHFTGFDRILLEGTIDRHLTALEDGTQLLIQSHKVILSNRHIPVEGHLLLFLKEESKLFHLGDRLRFLCKLYPPHGFHNPGGFSYERHLAFERIHTIGFLSEEKMWVKMGEGFKNPVLLRIEGWRDRIRDFLEKEGSPPSSAYFQGPCFG